MRDKFSLRTIDTRKGVVLDIETTGLDRHRDSITSLQLGWFDIDSGNFKMKFFDWSKLTEVKIQKLMNFLCNCKLVTHNGKFDFLFLLEKTGIELPIWHDTLVMAHVTGHEELGLKALTELYFGVSYDIEKEAKTGKITQELIDYGLNDIKYTLELYRILRKQLKEKAVEYTYAHEMRVYKAYFKIEQTGVPVSPRRYEIKKELQGEYEPILARLKEVAEINWNSNDQVGAVLFSPEGAEIREKPKNVVQWTVYNKTTGKELSTKFKTKKEATEYLVNKYGKTNVKEFGFSKTTQEKSNLLGYGIGLECKQYTAKGKPAVGVEALAEYSYHPVIADFLSYKGLVKLETFINSWEDLQVEGRIYPSFNIIAKTGRTTCNNPNLQQVPQKSMVRGLIEAQEGYTIISCFSGDTEVLTKEGWQRLDNLPKGVKVAEYDTTSKEISFSYPLAYIHNKNEEVYHYEDRAVSIKATKTHNVLTQYDDRPLRKQPFGEVNFSGANCFLNAGTYNNSSKESELFTRILAMFNADGSMSERGFVTFSFKKERKIARCRELLEEYGVDFSENTYFFETKGFYTVFYVGRRLNDKLLKYTDRDKTLKWSCLDTLPIKVYVEESIHWDGNKNKTASRVSTTNRQSADVFQAMCNLSGVRCRLSVHKSSRYSEGAVYYLNFNLQKPKYKTFMKDKWSFGKPSIEDTYCVTMPKGTLLIRHNDKISIQGNCDYSQAELRVASWFSGDENMQKAYNSGSDLHQSTLNLIYGDKLIDPEVDHDGAKRQRTISKSTNFGLVYGAMPQTLEEFIKQKGINISLKEAQELHKAFFKAYPGLKGFYERCKNFTRRHGYIESPIGRKRWLPDIFSSNWKLKSGAERQCINTPVQGMASDICISALADIVFDETLDHSKFNVLGSVHDAILIECKEEYAEELGEKVVKIMSNPSVLTNAGLKMPVPLKADLVINKSWGD